MTTSNTQIEFSVRTAEVWSSFSSRYDSSSRAEGRYSTEIFLKPTVSASAQGKRRFKMHTEFKNQNSIASR